MQMILFRFPVRLYLGPVDMLVVETETRVQAHLGHVCWLHSQLRPPFFVLRRRCRRLVTPRLPSLPSRIGMLLPL